MSCMDYYPEGTSLADLDAWWGDNEDDEDDEEDDEEDNDY